MNRYDNVLRPEPVDMSPDAINNTYDKKRLAETEKDLKLSAELLTY